MRRAVRCRSSPRRNVVMASLPARLLRSWRAWATVLSGGLAGVLLWYLTPYPRGMLMARIDHALGHYEVKGHGCVDFSTVKYARLLHQKYGIGANIFGGCVVSEQTACYEDGYNSVSV